MLFKYHKLKIYSYLDGADRATSNAEGGYLESALAHPARRIEVHRHSYGVRIINMLGQLRGITPGVRDQVPTARVCCPGDFRSERKHTASFGELTPDLVRGGCSSFSRRQLVLGSAPPELGANTEDTLHALRHISETLELLERDEVVV